MTRFCDFCPCESCRDGWSDHEVTHAKSDDGRWICEICYEYHVCQTFPERKGLGPCDDEDCGHRPKLVTPWLKLGEVAP